MFPGTAARLPQRLGAPIRMTSPATATITSTGTATPSVLALIVVGPGPAPWLRDCLLALANQSYPRLGVLAVDDDADEGSRELLNRSLGPRRVLRNERPLGAAHAVREALDRPMAKGADFILILEPSAALDRDAVARLVEAAVGIGVEDVGIVGAKIVDKDDPRSLRDIGRSSDRFGHPASALQPGEIDQGQFDRVLEVLCVSSAAMLIARDAWERAGMWDERLDLAHADLDLCWRIRVAGYRVLMTPLARVRVGDTGTARTGPRDEARCPFRGGPRGDHGDAQELRHPVARVARPGLAPDGGDPHRLPLARPTIRRSARRRRRVVVEPRASPRHRLATPTDPEGTAGPRP